MPQVISTNLASLNAQRNLNSSQAGLQTALQRLSSGLRRLDSSAIARSVFFCSAFTMIHSSSAGAWLAP